ncbi:hypothetical protein GDO81_013672 [Engystomops pustulosus]|uniref:Uncharacterized protein n=1 Tax=Engystomops pustulosus TaxID=76066 RepID=A0AAV7B268_ENGPU|nr:hypothetical protein GDO81_013672 [Engystomops pustulosus]
MYPYHLVETNPYELREKSTKKKKEKNYFLIENNPTSCIHTPNPLPFFYRCAPFCSEFLIAFTFLYLYHEFITRRDLCTTLLPSNDQSSQEEEFMNHQPLPPLFSTQVLYPSGRD